MLSCLRVRDFAIIDELEVELGRGLNVITGETGAGKSILVDALGLVLGGKGRADVVRSGAKRAEVEALFELADDPVARARMEASGLEPEPELVIRRTVAASGRTRAYVNGRLASAGQLAELARGLVDISSQHEHHTLVDPATHLAFLDAFGELGTIRDRVKDAYRSLRDADEALRQREEAAARRTEREDLLRFQIREIDDLAPTSGEDEALALERERLRHATRLMEAASGAEEALYAADNSLCAQVGRVANELRDAGRVDPEIAAHADAVESALTQLEETARELGAYARDVRADPARLEEVEERAHRLKRLVRKYGGDVDAVLAHRAEAEAELTELARVEEAIEALEQDREVALTRAADAARELSARRKEIATSLGDAISAELDTLGMGGAQVEVQIEPLAERSGQLVVDGARLGETGIDRVEFLIAANRGEVPRPLRKIASGGELSRAMLAIKRVLAGAGRAGLYVFDEVDSGVGGAVAEVIGRKLAEVAQHHQVICVTHLAQIAVYAESHYRVVKGLQDGRTVSRVERLDDAERHEEIARMVGGLQITKSTRDAAAEMLAVARAAM